MTVKLTHGLAAGLAAIAITVAGCGAPDAAQPGVTTSTVESDVDKTAPTVAALGTDVTDPDEVGNHFVTIIETHDARTDKDEWSSLHRGSELMTKELAASETAWTAGDKDSPWPSWVAEQVFVTPTVERNMEPTPEGTKKRRYQSYAVHLDPVSTVTGKQLTPASRIHYLELTETPDGWQISRWNTTPIVKGAAATAGTEKKEEK